MDRNPRKPEELCGLNRMPSNNPIWLKTRKIRNSERLGFILIHCFNRLLAGLWIVRLEQCDFWPFRSFGLGYEPNHLPLGNYKICVDSNSLAINRVVKLLGKIT